MYRTTNRQGVMNLERIHILDNSDWMTIVNGPVYHLILCVSRGLYKRRNKEGGRIISTEDRVNIRIEWARMGHNNYIDNCRD